MVLDGDIRSEVTVELYVPASEPGPIDPDPSSELSADYEQILAAKITQPGDNKIEIRVFRIQIKVKQKSVETQKIIRYMDCGNYIKRIGYCATISL